MNTLTNIWTSELKVRCNDHYSAVQGQCLVTWGISGTGSAILLCSCKSCLVFVPGYLWINTQRQLYIVKQNELALICGNLNLLSANCYSEKKIHLNTMLFCYVIVGVAWNLVSVYLWMIALKEAVHCQTICSRYITDVVYEMLIFKLW